MPNYFNVFIKAQNYKKIVDLNRFISAVATFEE